MLAGLRVNLQRAVGTPPELSIPTRAVPGGFGSTGRAVERERLHQQELRAVELLVLLGGDDRADDAGELHGWMSAAPGGAPSRLDRPVIDDADDARVDRGLGRMEREAGFPARARRTRARRTRADRIGRDEHAPGRARRRRSAA